MKSNLYTQLLVLLLFFGIVLLHATFISLPLFISALIIRYILTRNLFVFFISFTTGLLTDIVLVRQIGATSIFLVLFLFFVILYERKFEIDSLYFVFFATLMGSIAYLFGFGYNFILLLALLNALLGVSFYMIIQVFKKKEQRTLDYKKKYYG